MLGIDPTLDQTRLLKRWITMQDLPVPEHGPLAAVSVRTDWFQVIDSDEMTLRITRAGACAFWRGVRLYGRAAVMQKPTLPPISGGCA